MQDGFGRAMTLRITGVFRTTCAVGFWPAMAGNLPQEETADQLLLVVSASALNGSAVLNGQLTARWSVQPDFSRIGAGALAGLHDRLRAFSGSQSCVSVFGGRQPSLDDLTVVSGLSGAIDDLTVPSVAARSSLYLPGAMLAALALATSVLAARQLTVDRHKELALQRARGAGTLRLLRGAAAEWALTGVPAAVAAPFLPGLLHPGSRGGGGSDPAGARRGGAAARAAVDAVAADPQRTGRCRAAAGCRPGAAGRRIPGVSGAAAAPLTARRPGHRSASADPVLVLVPILVAGTAALLLLRLLPLTSLPLDAFGRRSRGLVLVLTGWQLSRQFRQRRLIALFAVTQPRTE
ncbi:hypothetical protein ACGF5O_37855 [Streptomyces sp. NPDC048291]|uniref:hypothetical protein n=1 Tax=Streptomyces sp. NPDC048291 TaxID=3365530 RepID=UPI003716089E